MAASATNRRHCVYRWLRAVVFCRVFLERHRSRWAANFSPLRRWNTLHAHMSTELPNRDLCVSSWQLVNMTWSTFSFATRLNTMCESSQLCLDGWFREHCWTSCLVFVTIILSFSIRLNILLYFTRHSDVAPFSGRSSEWIWSHSRRQYPKSWARTHSRVAAIVYNKLQMNRCSLARIDHIGVHEVHKNCLRSETMDTAILLRKRNYEGRISNWEYESVGQCLPLQVVLRQYWQQWCNQQLDQNYEQCCLGHQRHWHWS